MILDTVLNYERSDSAIPGDFGAKIHAGNIEGHLANIRSEEKRYRKSHPEEVVELQELADTAKRFRMRTRR